jgi:hypothetical protein
VSPRGIPLATKAWGNLPGLRSHVEYGVSDYVISIDRDKCEKWSDVPMCPISRDVIKTPVLVVPVIDKWENIDNRRYDYVSGPYDRDSIKTMFEGPWMKWDDCKSVLGFLDPQERMERDLNKRVKVVSCQYLVSVLSSGDSKGSHFEPYTLPVRDRPPEFTLAAVSPSPVPLKGKIDWANGQETDEIKKIDALAKLCKFDDENRTGHATVSNAYFSENTFTIHGKQLEFDNCLFEKCKFEEICWCMMRMRLCRFVSCTFKNIRAHSKFQMTGNQFIDCRVECSAKNKEDDVISFLKGVDYDSVVVGERLKDITVPSGDEDGDDDDESMSD